MIRAQPLIILLMLLAFAPRVGMADDATFCPSWEKLYRTAHRGFMPYRGAYNADFQEFVAKASLPAASSCSVEEDEFDFQYSCRWRYESGEQAQAVADAKDFSGAIRQCLSTKKPRSERLDDLSGLPNFLWRDEIPDNDNAKLRTHIVVSITPERKTRSGRVFPAYVATAVRIRFERE